MMERNTVWKDLCHKEFGLPMSLVPGREPLNTWNFPSDQSVFVIDPGPLVYSNEMTQGAAHARNTNPVIRGFRL